MIINFLKMSGAGNDFIMVDNRKGEYTSILTGQLIAELCRRGLSVGADGRAAAGVLPALPTPSRDHFLRVYRASLWPCRTRECGHSVYSGTLVE